MPDYVIKDLNDLRSFHFRKIKSGYRHELWAKDLRDHYRMVAKYNKFEDRVVEIKTEKY